MADDGTIAALLRDLLAPGSLALIAGVSGGVGVALTRGLSKGFEIWREVKVQDLAEKKEDRAERREANLALGATNATLGEIKVAFVELRSEIQKGNRLNTDQRDRLDMLIRGQGEQVAELRGLNSADITARKSSVPPEGAKR